jgi:hypothetical protein
VEGRPPSWLRRLSNSWFPSRAAVRQRRNQMALFLTGLVCIVLAIELLQMGESAVPGPMPVPPWAVGYLLLFVGVGLALIGFGYLATPLEPWRSSPHSWEERSTLPPPSVADPARVAHQARLLVILLLVAGLLLLEALPMLSLAVSTKLFNRDNCTYNCQALTGAEVAFLLDLIPIAIADAFVVIMLFVYIEP